MLIVLGLYFRIRILRLRPSASLLRSPCNPMNRKVFELSNAAVGTARLIRMGATKHMGPLLLTWFNFNPSMDK